MITWQAVNYAKVLFTLEVSDFNIQKTKQIFRENSELIRALDNPMIDKKEKDAVIEAVFDKDICNFIKLLCDNRNIDLINEIFDAHETMELESKNIIQAKLTYAVKLMDEEIEQIKAMICKKYNKTGVSLELIEDVSLIGGYVLKIGDTEYDKSIQGALVELQKTLVGR